MQYTDRIYGKIEIKETVVIELINSPALQRLKEIDQTGYPEPFMKGIKHSRFEHSLGVFILLKKFKAPLEEQIAGLIHDVSHSAFSHCIDYALGEKAEKNHDTQDNVFQKFVLNSEIPEILKKYKFDPEYVVDEKNFPLKEKELPDLCADRIDYSLRTAFIYKEIDKKGVDYFLTKLHPRGVKRPFWMFQNIESAKVYADLFLKLNTVYYAGLLSAIMFRTVGDYLKHALQKKYITVKDLYTTDQIILNKINKYLVDGRLQDNKLKILWHRMNNKVYYKIDKKDYNAHVFIKSRVVDPLCFHKNKVKRLSEINTYWQKVLIQESQPKEYFIRFEKVKGK